MDSVRLNTCRCKTVLAASKRFINTTCGDWYKLIVGLSIFRALQTLVLMTLLQCCWYLFIFYLTIEYYLFINCTCKWQWLILVPIVYINCSHVYSSRVQHVTEYIRIMRTSVTNVIAVCLCWSTCTHTYTWRGHWRSAVWLVTSTPNYILF